MSEIESRLTQFLAF